MPRTSNKKQALKDIKHAAQAIAGYIALSGQKTQWKTLEVLVIEMTLCPPEMPLSII